MRKRAIFENVALTVGTVFALAGSVAFVWPASEPVASERVSTQKARGHAGWIDAWTREGGQVVTDDATPPLRALQAWYDAGLTGEPSGLCFVHPERGVVARALHHERVGTLVYEAGRDVRLLHPGMGRTELERTGEFYVSRRDQPVEHLRLGQSAP